MKTKNIVIAIPDLKGNGAERVMMTLATELHRQGHRVTFVCFTDKTELVSDVVIPRIHFPMNRLRWIPRKVRGLATAPLLDAFIRRHVGVPDLVLSNLEPVDRILARSRLAGVHLVIHNTMSEDHRARLTGTKAARQMDYLTDVYSRKPSVAVSAGVRADFQRLFPQAPTCTHIYNPVDVDFVRRHAVGKPFLSTDYIVHVGGFKHAKRHDLLVEAYAKSGIAAPLLLVGKGPLRPEVERQVQALGLTDRVVFAGFHANPYPIIANARAMVLSSDFEGLAMVLLEALALGVPAISTDCPSGPAEFLPPANLAPPNDADALAALIARLDAAPENFTTPFAAQFLPPHAVTAYLDLIT